LGGNKGAEGCEAKADGVVLCENGLIDALPPGPNTEPVLAGTLVDALPPGPKTEPTGLAVVVDALPPGPKTDPVEFVFENTEPPKADPVPGGCVPNTEGGPNTDVDVSCAGVPKADVVAAGGFPKDG
jgi:hypothetical protein